MTTEALSGEINVIGKSGTNYVFGFGWACRFNLEEIYGPGLQGMLEETDQAKIISNMLLAALRAKASNKISSEFTRKEMYDLLDDLGEEKVKQVWGVAQHSMGFLNRLLGLSDELVAELAVQATKRITENQSQPQLIGTDSSNLE